MPDRMGDRIRLRHALDAILAIESYVGNTTLQTFVENPMMRDACIRQIQVLGESCRSISNELREQYPEIPWRQIVGMRNIVIHEYFGIDDRIVWEIIQNDLPAFKIQLESIQL